MSDIIKKLKTEATETLKEMGGENLKGVGQATLNSLATTGLEVLVTQVAKHVPRFEEQINSPLGRVLAANVLNVGLKAVAGDKKTAVAEILRNTGQTLVTMSYQPTVDNLLEATADKTQELLGSSESKPE